MSVAYIGIGSNLGDRQKNIELALEKLKARKGIELREFSSIIETEPVGDADQPKFFNAACKLETSLYPDELLNCLKSIEREIGRKEDSSVPRISRQEQLKMFQEGSLDLDAQLGPTPEERQERLEESKRSGPRTIDLDILFYDDVMMKGNSLIIPHPRLHNREFVLRPLAEIAPDFIHPALKKSVNDLLIEQKAEDEPVKETPCEDAKEPPHEDTKEPPYEGSEEPPADVQPIQ